MARHPRPGVTGPGAAPRWPARLVTTGLGLLALALAGVAVLAPAVDGYVGPARLTPTCQAFGAPPGHVVEVAPGIRKRSPQPRRRPGQTPQQPAGVAHRSGLVLEDLSEEVLGPL